MTYIQALAILGVILVAAVAAFFGKRYFLAASLFAADAYLWMKLREFTAIPSYNWGGPGWLLFVVPQVLAVALVIGFLFDYANRKAAAPDAGKTRFRQTILWLLFGGIVIIVAATLLVKYASIALY